MKTLISVILDESGSMGGKATDVIGGFNRFLDDQRSGPDPCRLALVKFNTVCTVVYEPRPVADVAPLTTQTYVPGGMTALHDAVAHAVRLLDGQKAADERVLCLVITDGEENSSRETTKEQVRKIIAEREARGDWTFTYLGISPDQWHEHGGLRGNAAAYDPHQPRASFAAMSHATSAYRASAAAQSKTFYRPPASTPHDAPPEADAPKPAPPATGRWDRPHP